MPYRRRQCLLQRRIPGILQIGIDKEPSLRLLEGISCPHFLLTSPLQVHQHEKSHSSPKDFVVQCSQCICMAAQFFALRESLSHAQTAGSNSDPHDTIQSLLCLAF